MVANGPAAESRNTGVVAVFPDPAPVEIIRLLDLNGYRWKGIEPAAGDYRAAFEGRTEWDCAIAVLGDDSEATWRFCGDVRSSEIPVMLLVGGTALDAIADRHECFDDFVIT
ncbi:MAG: hypothetical protein OEZ14_05880, partial [Acidimicrobiia bacterium]|nr:hypothetical protein [Acidimicrobiia bacterium]